MDAVIAGWYILWFVLTGAIGVAIGKHKARSGVMSAILGILLGPIGWLALAIGPDYRPQCPECRGVIVTGARRCQNCGIELPQMTRAQQLRASA